MLLKRLNAFGIWKRKVKVFGHVFRALTLDRLASLVLHKFGVLNRDEVEILRRLVHSGMMVVDVGANQGLYTVLLADLARPGKVFAFEPQPLLYRQLVANVCENRMENVECYQMAVSSSPGTLTLQLDDLNLGDNRIVAADAEKSNCVQVKAATLDQLFEGKKIDFLKIDTQGWEAAALAGGRDVLESNPGIVLLFEFWPFGLRKAGADPKELLSYLTQLRFVIYKLKRSRLVSLCENDLPDPSKQFAYCNLIALRDRAKFADLLS
jgi:FkbM family methyltransferase